MTVSHIDDVVQTPSLWRLAGFIRQHQQQWQERESPPDFERFERELHDHVMAVERDLLADELKRDDVTADEVTGEGVSYRPTVESTQTYMSTAGPITVSRHLYRPAGRGSKSICPLERQRGMVQGLWTPRAARQGAFAMAHLTPRESAMLFEEIGGMTPSASTLDRLPKTLSSRFEVHRDAWEATLRSRETVPEEAAILAVSLDGVMAPMAKADLETDAPTESEAVECGEGASEKTSDPRHYREASCGTVSLYDAEGHRLSTIRYGRMPESKKATLCAQLQAECQSIMALRPDLQVVKLADGAEANWRFLDHLDLGLSEAQAAEVESVCITDFYHAAEHLHQACTLIWGAGSVETKVEFARLRTLLEEDEQGVDKVIRRLRYRASQLKGKKRDELEKELAYFRNQRHRMSYALYRQAKFPIGSGIVEAACKTLVSSRLKRSGMRWTIAGGQAILTLRSLIQSERWSRAWFLFSNDCHKPVTIKTTNGPKALDPAA
jgi:hypothetical protein